MRGSVTVAVCLLLVLGNAAADEKADLLHKPLTPEQAAEKVLAAVGTKDGAALKALAGKDDPDPWLVADELCFRGESEAALAFARAAPRRATEHLESYLSHDELTKAPALRELNGRIVALARSKNASGLVDATDGITARTDGAFSIRLLALRARALNQLERPQASVEAYTALARRAEARGWLRLAALAHMRVGDIHAALKNVSAAKPAFDRELALRVKAKDRIGEAYALRSAAWVQNDLAQPEEAILLLRRARAIWEGLQNRRGVARTLATIAYFCSEVLADYPRALSYYERALAVSTELNDRSAMAHIASNTAYVYVSLGDYSRALTHYDRSLRLYESMDNRTRVTLETLRIGVVHRDLGEYAKALYYAERALTMAQALEERELEGTCLVEQGQALTAMREHERALSCFEKARALWSADPEHSDSGHILRWIAAVYESLGDLQAALRFHQKALALFEKVGDRHHERVWSAVQLRCVGKLQQRLGNVAEARSSLERALEVSEQTRNRRLQAGTLQELGELHAQAGDQRTAGRYLQRAIALARRIRAKGVLVQALGVLGRIRLDAGEHALALASARQALTEIETLLGGLAEAESAAGRERFADIFGTGAVAAARLDDPHAVLEFLESGRAGALLETLGGGRAALFADLPEGLLREEAGAKGAEVRARSLHSRALDARDLKAARDSGRVLDEAMDRRRRIAARIQREAKRVAGVFYPRAAPLEEIQGWLRAGTALIVYGLCLDEALAIAVTPDSQRIVRLGSKSEIEAACAAVAPLLEQPEKANDLAVGIARLRSLLIEPLGLGQGVKSVLISPAGAMGYVPWGALLERPVACVPSGTTWVLLREDKRRPGTKILALGDPAYDAKPGDRTVETYRGGKLLRLPATRDEALAIGDVVLLGEKATETGLAKALQKEERWRAVHLACHGLVDSERPLLSSLALTPDEKEDGFLAWLDVFRLHIPADLVVLSACETARGKVAKAEGIVGLTRAFMYAGAPRVICSLWKVDDEATQALMVKFYALWHPKDGSKGIGAAAALKQAQAFVRGQAKWKHPYYWAAWVLWGLPE